ncbi:MAG: VWA domain-containing protein [Desulfuromonadales bacterium]|nr:VWA domain-containing protein [Desulfuromonadales bacterium]MDT8423406.1 VWA domain-containing protein [Desulfuromonadales bacterium]
MQLTLSHPGLLLLLPLLIVPFLPRRSAALHFSTLEPLAQRPTWRLRLERGRPFLAATIILLLIGALVDPTRQEHVQETLRRGRNLMLVLDISTSMAATDLAPNRLAVARREATRFVSGRPDDRIGVVLFSGIPYLLTPPTLSRGVILDRLDQVRADQRGSGTAIGDALGVALARLTGAPPDSAAIILLTDGISNRGRLAPTAAARAAAALGIRIYTIGFGTDFGGDITLSGQQLHVGLATQELRKIARLSHGRYFRALSGDELETVYQQIDALEKTSLVTTKKIARTSLRPLILTLLLIALLVEVILYRGWLRRMP